MCGRSLLSLMMVVAFIWMTFEIRGYQASLKSWSSLTDDMFQDEMDTRREAYASYMRWKKQQESRSRWIPGFIRDCCGSSMRSDFERSQHGDPNEQVEVHSSSYTSGTTPMEVEEVQEEITSERESEKRRRYAHLELSEASDTELWMQVHHHDDLGVDEENNQHAAGDDAQLDLEPQLQDMVRAGDLALRVYEQRRQQALDRGDFEALGALGTMNGFALCDFLAWL